MSHVDIVKNDWVKAVQVRVGWVDASYPDVAARAAGATGSHLFRTLPHEDTECPFRDAGVLSFTKHGGSDNRDEVVPKERNK